MTAAIASVSSRRWRAGYPRKLKAAPCNSDNEFVSARSAADGPPRLVFRFALYSAMALLIASLGVLWLVRHEAQQGAEADVGERARWVAASLPITCAPPTSPAQPGAAWRRWTRSWTTTS